MSVTAPTFWPVSEFAIDTVWPGTVSPFTPMRVAVAVAVEEPSAVIVPGFTDTATVGAVWVRVAVADG